VVGEGVVDGAGVVGEGAGASVPPEELRVGSGVALVGAVLVAEGEELAVLGAVLGAVVPPVAGGTVDVDNGGTSKVGASVAETVEGVEGEKVGYVGYNVPGAVLSVGETVGETTTTGIVGSAVVCVCVVGGSVVVSVGLTVGG